MLCNFPEDTKEKIIEYYLQGIKHLPDDEQPFPKELNEFNKIIKRRLMRNYSYIPEPKSICQEDNDEEGKIANYNKIDEEIREFTKMLSVYCPKGEAENEEGQLDDDSDTTKIAIDCLDQGWASLRLLLVHVRCSEFDYTRFLEYIGKHYPSLNSFHTNLGAQAVAGVILSVSKSNPRLRELILDIDEDMENDSENDEEEGEVSWGVRVAESFKDCTTITNLTGLVINHKSIDWQVLEAIRKTCPNLQYLSIIAHPTDTFSKISDDKDSQFYIRKLCISNIKDAFPNVDDSSGKFRPLGFNSTAFPILEELEICCSLLKDNDDINEIVEDNPDNLFRTVFSLPWDNLKVLKLPMFSDKLATSITANCLGLAVLDIRQQLPSMDLTSNGILTILQSLPDLVSLHIDHCQEDQISTSRISNSLNAITWPCRGLQKLHLGNLAFDLKDSALVLKNQSFLKEIKIVVDSSINSDDDNRDFWNQVDHQHLYKLQLVNNQQTPTIEDEYGTKDTILTILESLPAVKVLHVDGTRLSKDILITLNESRPNLDIMQFGLEPIIIEDQQQGTNDLF